MHKILCLYMLLVFVSASAQKVVYDANAIKRNIAGFHAIEVSSGIDLYLSNGDEAIAVSASETKYRDRIKTQVVDGVLKIWYDKEDKNSNLVFTNTRKLKAYVSFKNLDRLSASGGSDVSVHGTINSPKLVLIISGGSDFEGKVNVKKMVVEQSGGSDIDIAGNANEVNIEASGGSDFDGYDLSAEVCIVNASGGSDVEISVSKEINANASGGSDVSYKGKAVVKEKKTSGASSVSRKA